MIYEDLTMKRLKLIFLAIILYAFALPNALSLKISTLIIPMVTQNGRIFIDNELNTDAFADIRLERIINPGTKEEKRKIFKLGDNPEEFGLLIPSSEVVIQANDREYISLILTKTALDDEERVFYATMTPFDGTRYGKAYSAPKTISGGVRMIFSYQVRIIQLPNNIKYDLRIKEVNKLEDKVIVKIENHGNSYQRVYKAMSCPTKEPEPDWESLVYVTEKTIENNCTQMSPEFLYSNMSKEYNVKNGNTLYLLIKKENSPLNEWPIKKYINLS
jgi:hypothetical protein